MNNMSTEEYRRLAKDDVDVDIEFFCKVGQTTAKLSIYIEPDPLADGKGTHAHFHTMILCPKVKIVDFPEPDRCVVTDNTCTFVEPFGGLGRDEVSRKWECAHRFIHNATSIEINGKYLLSASLRSKGFDIQGELPELSYQRIIEFLFALRLIDKETFRKLDNIRRKRNELVHDLEAYMKFVEKELFDMTWEARQVANELRKKSLHIA